MAFRMHVYASKLAENQTASGCYKNACIYHSQGQWDKAVSLYTKALELSPSNTHILINRADCFSEKKKYIAAIVDLTVFLNGEPENVRALVKRGNAFYKIGKFLEAIEDLTMAVSLNDTKVLAYEIRGLVYFHIGQFENALLDANCAIKLDAESFLGYICRGNIYCNEKKYETALLDYAQAYLSNPECILDKNFLQTCLTNCKDFSAIAANILFALIKQLPASEAKTLLLKQCLREGNPLGDRMRDIDLPGENCNFKNGILKDIYDYLRAIEPDFVILELQVSVSQCGLFKTVPRRAVMYEVERVDSGKENNMIDDVFYSL